MEISLSDKRALVCGSTQGIGKAIAMEMAMLGASVTLVARNEEALKTVRGELRKEAGQEHHYIVADFAYPEDLQRKVQDYLSSINAVHILVNNTGGPAAGGIFGADPGSFKKAFDQHVICNQILAQELVPIMKRSGYGRIVNIISTSVKEPIPGLGVSNTIRAAVAAWSKTLAGEIGHFGITVNNILPGFTQTGRLESLINGKAEKSGKTTKAIENELQAGIPLGRFASAAEVANVVAFLAGPAASYIHGANIPVDGGKISSF